MINITVFIPLYNAENYIKKTIQSVLNQTYKNFEILIINDASTDQSVSIVESFSDDRIRLIHNDTNKGICYTRQRGVIEARGKYIAILDADDIAMPNRLEKQFAFLEKNPEIAVCGSDAYFIDENDQPINHKHDINFDSKIIKIENLFANQFINSSALIRKKCIIEVGNYSMKYCEDYDLFVKITEKFETTNLDEKLVCYRMHSKGDSKTKKELYENAIVDILNYQYKKLGIKKELSYIPYLLFHKDILSVKIIDFYPFFKTVIDNNKKLKVYDNTIFEKKFITIWLTLVLHHKNFKEAWKLFLHSSFKMSYLVNSKQKRRFFKLLINPFKI